MRTFVAQFVILVSVITGFIGCSLLKAGEAESTKFLPKPALLSEQRDRAPFQGYWVSDPTELDQFKKTSGRVYIAPVNIEAVVDVYRSADDDEETKQERIEEATQLANYFRERIRLNLSGATDSSVKVAESPADALSLNLALVQLVPSNPGINLVGTAAGFFIPGGGLIKIAGESSAAIEGYSCQGGPDIKLFEQFKDREGQKASPFTLKDFQRYAHIRVMLDDWASQIAQLLATSSAVEIEESLPFSVDPL
jgi:hypothetical protein